MTSHPSVRAATASPFAASRGVVENLFPAEEYGLLRTEDGRELVFDRDGVDDEFDRLGLGVEVMYREVASEEGPRAVDVVRIA